jgi:hypothetical protein
MNYIYAVLVSSVSFVIFLFFVSTLILGVIFGDFCVVVCVWSSCCRQCGRAGVSRVVLAFFAGLACMCLHFVSCCFCFHLGFSVVYRDANCVFSLSDRFPGGCGRGWCDFLSLISH